MDLIKLSETNKDFPVDSRDLNKVLEVRSEHYHWIARRISDLEINTDYVVYDANGEKIYLLSEDSSKHFALMEKNERGRQVRQWVIEKEEQLRNEVAMLSPLLKC